MHSEAAEYTALKNVYDEYIKQIMFGFVEPESGIAEMEEKLESAGLNEYIEAKQAAIDEWAKQPLIPYKTGGENRPLPTSRFIRHYFPLPIHQLLPVLPGAENGGNHEKRAYTQ